MVVLSEKTRRVEVKIEKTSNIQPRTSASQRMPGAEHRLFDRGRWVLDVLRWVLTPLVALELLTTGALAAGLEADLKPMGLRARNAAPVPVEARFKWDGPRILEGRLEMEFHEGNRVLGRYRSGELALAGGEQKFRMLLPPPSTPFSDSQVEVQMKFVTAGNVVALDPSILFLPTVSERSLVVAWCAPVAAGGWQQSGIERNLLVERFAPSPDRISQRLLTTSIVRLAPDDLPGQPLAYTSFDVVVLTADAFKEASERQLEALARWIKGGGSVCVFVGGGLQSHHLRFLNQLAESAPGGPRFLVDDAGNLVAVGKEILSLRSGLGRSVIVPDAAVADVNTNAAACRKVAAFLWKIRSRQAQAIADLGHWDEETNSSTQYNPTGQPQPSYVPRSAYRNTTYYAEPPSYSVHPGALGAELMNQLMPRTVRLIPFSALMGMLALFLLMIGPVDYFVLGRLRRRRLTWVLFPATSVAFLVATVLMANHYLGLRDQRTSLTVVDLARDGTALRWNRYELVFAARDKQSLTELKDALWVPLNVQATPGQIPFNPYTPNRAYYSRNGVYNYGGSYPSGAPAAGDIGPPLYEGVLPVHFQTREALRQWQPELNRTFSFEPPPVPLFRNWSMVEEAWPNLETIRAKLSEDTPFNGDVYSISASSSITADSGSTGIVPAPILEELCVGDSSGLLSLVSQISPTGGGNFEDVQAMDLETHDAALIIVTRNGDDVVVYRRFYYGK
jgi:hypothetical protein